MEPISYFLLLDWCCCCCCFCCPNEMINNPHLNLSLLPTLLLLRLLRVNKQKSVGGEPLEFN